MVYNGDVEESCQKKRVKDDRKASARSHADQMQARKIKQTEEMIEKK